VLFKLQERRVELLGEEHFVAPNATLIGSVVLHDRSSVWFNAVLRGDNEPIVIGEESNVQDGTIMHTDPGMPVSVGRGVTIGHMAMLHGCEVGDNSLVGIKATVLNGARIGKHCLIGAGALITEGKQIPDYSMVLGSPGRVVRQLDPERIEMLHQAAQIYVRKIRVYRESLESQS
jgi:carbonic anhydrase/acetyltransferase-like protein (isoleucine patch superfamily)